MSDEVKDATDTAQSECNGLLCAWMPINTAPRDTKEMFVVRAFNVVNGFTGCLPYTTDPWCVWREQDGSFARWPHNFMPTH